MKSLLRSSVGAPHVERRRASEMVVLGLDVLDEREKKVIFEYFGLAGGPPKNLSQVSRRFGVSHSMASRLLRGALAKMYGALFPDNPKEEEERLDAHLVVERIRKLTPELIAHLKQHASDLDLIPWPIYEHLIGEFLAAAGFEDVQLMGKNAFTGADIFASYPIGPLGTKMKYFVEVKRWKDRVGVEVIDRVHGALFAEKASFGWHAALIVSSAGFKDFRKYSRHTLDMMGIYLRDREAILKWLHDYQPNNDGLWLPSALDR
jgi:Restriction endonuclease/Sigma-70, region 4